MKEAAVSELMTQDVCTSSSVTLRCDSTFNTNYGPFLNEALHGVKAVPGNDTCVFK